MSERTSKWTLKDIAQVRLWYESRKGGALDLDGLASLIGRPKPDVCEAARKLGLTERNRKPGRKPRRKYATDEESRQAIGKAASERIKTNGHPRGALGMKHSPETRERISVSQKALFASGKHGASRPKTKEERAALSERTTKRLLERPSSVYSSAKRGYRDDMPGIFFRSRWEANYARFLTLLQRQGKIVKWEFEKDTFWFEAIRRGVRSYTPDFKVWLADGSYYYDEVKGWMDPKSKTKLKRMAKYHPNVKVNVIDSKAYREIDKKLGGAIPCWEHK